PRRPRRGRRRRAPPRPSPLPSPRRGAAPRTGWPPRPRSRTRWSPRAPPPTRSRPAARSCSTRRPSTRASGLRGREWRAAPEAPPEREHRSDQDQNRDDDRPRLAVYAEDAGGPVHRRPDAGGGGQREEPGRHDVAGHAPADRREALGGAGAHHRSRDRVGSGQRIPNVRGREDDRGAAPLRGEPLGRIHLDDAAAESADDPPAAG